jgi:hypothetical protein
MLTRKRVSDGRTHGTRSSYNAGCRCRKCKAANTQASKARRLRFRLAKAEQAQLPPEQVEALHAQQDQLKAAMAANKADNEGPVVVGRPDPNYGDEVEQFLVRHRQGQRPVNAYEIPESAHFPGEEVEGETDDRCPRCGRGSIVFNLDGSAYCERCRWEGVLPPPAKVPSPAPDSPMALRYGESPPGPRMHSIPATRPGGWG